MLIVLSLFFLLVWLVFIKFRWLPRNRPWKIAVASVALVIALVVVSALQYYTPAAFSSAEAGYPVRIAFPEGLSPDLARVGSLAQVTVFTSDGNPINVLAKILQWISTWVDYVA